MSDSFIGADGKEYRYANVLGRTMLCEVVRPKPKRDTAREASNAHLDNLISRFKR